MNTVRGDWENQRSSHMEKPSLEEGGKAPLPAAAWSALQAASVVGEAFDLSLLEALGYAVDELDAAFDSGWLISESPPQVRFVSRSAREQVLATMSWSAARRLNDRMADLLLSQKADETVVAQRLAAAHRFPEASQAWLQAGQKACDQQMFADAQKHMTEALRLCPATAPPAERLNILRAMAHCCERAGQRDDLAEICGEMLRQAKADPSLEWEAHGRLASLAEAKGETLNALEHRRLAAQAADRTPDELTRGQAWLDYGKNLTECGRVAEAAAALRRAHQLAEATGNHSLKVYAKGDLALALAIGGQATEARELTDAVMEIALELGRHDFVAFAYRRQANVADYRSDYRAERDRHLAALERCRLQPGLEDEQACLACLACTFVRTGEWARALETAQRVLQNEPQGVLAAIARVALTLVHTFRGELRRGLDLGNRCLNDFRRYGAGSFEFYPLWNLAFAHEQSDAAEQAAELYREIRVLWRQREDLHDAVPGLFFGAALACDMKDAQALADCVDIAVTIAASNPSEEHRGAAEAAQAEQAALQGRTEAACEAYAKAVANFDRLGSPMEIAQVRWRYWRHLSAQGRLPEATQIAEPAIALSKRLGMRPYLDRFQEKAWIAGAADPQASDKENRPAASRTVPKEGLLTARQIDVLRAAGEGLTNKEAAAKLNLSPRTVEMHMARTLERLNCRTRTEAVRKASDSGLLD